MQTILNITIINPLIKSRIDFLIIIRELFWDLKRLNLNYSYEKYKNTKNNR